MGNPRRLQRSEFERGHVPVLEAYLALVEPALSLTFEALAALQRGDAAGFLQRARAASAESGRDRFAGMRTSSVAGRSHARLLTALDDLLEGLRGLHDAIAAGDMAAALACTRVTLSGMETTRTVLGEIRESFAAEKRTLRGLDG